MSESNETPCPQPGQFGWLELLSRDTAASASFYGHLFGWEAEPYSPQGRASDAPPYTIFKLGGNKIAGMVKPSVDSPTQWVPYVVVEDVEVSLARAVDLKAAVILPVMDIGEVGRIAVVQDPQGAILGFHEFPKPK